jgi:hypothetical protein
MEEQETKLQDILRVSGINDAPPIAVEGKLFCLELNTGETFKYYHKEDLMNAIKEHGEDNVKSIGYFSKNVISFEEKLDNLLRNV